MRSEKGFTLVEVILAIGIFAIVAVPIVSMFLDGIKLTSKTENTSEAYAYAQQYVEKLKGGEILVETTEAKPIGDTDYTYEVEVKKKTIESNDGEDFYKYMNGEISHPISLTDDEIAGCELDGLESVEIDSDKNWKLLNEDKELYDYIIVEKNNIWLQYDLSSGKKLKIKNDSGEEINIYLQFMGDNEINKNLVNPVNIINLGGVINVYGPVTKTPDEIEAEKRGRKHTAEVTVTVNNKITGEHAELTANVTYYDV